MNPANSVYDSMMYAGTIGPYDSSKAHVSSTKHQLSQDSSGTSVNPINFTDYDDEFGNYYLRKTSNQLGNPYNRKLTRRNQLPSSSDDSKTSKAIAWLVSIAPEAVDSGDDQSRKRVKRQAHYESSYEKEPPCYGFPLEVHIKSRIKMDQIFPIFGKSQFKKCIKVG